jgi:hypothetical protein
MSLSHAHCTLQANTNPISDLKMMRTSFESLSLPVHIDRQATNTLRLSTILGPIALTLLYLVIHDHLSFMLDPCVACLFFENISTSAALSEWQV